VVQVGNLTRGTTLAEACVLGVTFYWRARGLMLRRAFEPFDGLWLAPTASIHMFWVAFPIDLVWLDADLRVLAVTPGIKPWRLDGCRRAASVLELRAGAIAASGTQVGDRIAFNAPPPAA
jgi:hypothetical protein